MRIENQMPHHRDTETQRKAENTALRIELIPQGFGHAELALGFVFPLCLCVSVVKVFS
jgi:hypothetical protein